MAKGAYLGISDTARKVKNIYVGVNGVARKIKKAYIGDENGLARLCYSAGIPFASGTITTTSYSSSLEITNLSFAPTFAFILFNATSSNKTPKLMGLYAKSVFYDNYGRINVMFSDDVAVTYGTSSVKITNIATSSAKNTLFTPGSYSYIILGVNTNNNNVAYGTKTISRGTTTMTVSGLSFTPNKGMAVFYDSWGDNSGTQAIRTASRATRPYEECGSDDCWYYLGEAAVSNSIVFSSGSATFNGTSSYQLADNRSATAYYVVWREE